MMRTTSKSNLISAILLDLPWASILGDSWKYFRKLLRGFAQEGLYEVLEYEMFLEIKDVKGKHATHRKHQTVRYLQNNITTITDQAWGDGKILLNYRCSPGKAVDQYRSGHKTLVLISLRQIRNRGDKDNIRIQWGMNNTFLTKTEEWTTTISHRTKKLRLNVIFPEKRPPLKMDIIETNRSRQTRLGKDHLTQRPDKRWQVIWEKTRPRLYEDYTFRWRW